MATVEVSLMSANGGGLVSTDFTSPPPSAVVIVVVGVIIAFAIEAAVALFVEFRGLASALKR